MIEIRFIDLPSDVAAIKYCAIKAFNLAMLGIFYCFNQIVQILENQAVSADNLAYFSDGAGAKNERQIP